VENLRSGMQFRTSDNQRYNNDKISQQKSNKKLKLPNLNINKDR
jgi:hypothetical protein